MKPLGTATSLLLALLLVAGCASSPGLLGDEKIARPGRIIVYDFAASPADLPADSAVTGHYEERATPQTAEEVELGRQLGDRLAAQLVSEIRAMGLAVERAGSGLPPHPGDLVIRGEFVSIDEGSSTKRVLIGFGAGTANLQTLVEVYQVTATGLRPIGSHEIEAGGGRTPGLLLPVGLGAVAFAAVGVGKQALSASSIERAADETATEVGAALSAEFQRRGWIRCRSPLESDRQRGVASVCTPVQPR
jgi:Domain of unknown function (DUF4410)